MAASIGSEDGDIGFQIAPMVDVVFVLMLFFMASAGSQISEKEITTPFAGTGKGLGVTAIVIDINADGSVAMNNQKMGQPSDRTLGALREFFTNTIQTFGNEDPVVIAPSPDARQERIVDVLNAAAACQVKHLTLR